MQDQNSQQDGRYPAWIGGISEWERDLMDRIFTVTEAASWENPSLSSVRAHFYRALYEFIEDNRPLLLAESARALSWPFPEDPHKVRKVLRQDIPQRGENYGVYMTTIDEVVGSLHPETERVIIEGLRQGGSGKVREVIHTGEEMLFAYVEPRLELDEGIARYNINGNVD